MKSRKGELNPNYKGGPRKCSVGICMKNAIAKGLCQGHYNRLKKTGDIMAEIPLSKSRPGSSNSNWRGGIRVSRGRTYVYSPDHPNATKQKTVARYRLNAEKKLGRLLTKKEIVHHGENGVQCDEDSNLSVMTQGPHARIHFAKTPIETVIEIRRLGKSKPAREIAEQFNIPARRVYSIRNRETWKDI